MKRLINQVVLAGAALAGLSGPSIAKDPLLTGSSGAVVVADKELATVKGSGYYANLYSYYGSYYLSNAVYYDNLGQYYNYLGYDGPNNSATNNYYSAYQNANNAATYFYYAYYYSYYKS